MMDDSHDYTYAPRLLCRRQQNGFSIFTPVFRKERNFLSQRSHQLLDLKKKKKEKGLVDDIVFLGKTLLIIFAQ
jgi:hypothetical protein